MKNKYVKNPLSEIPGGSTVKIVFTDGKEQFQENVKYPNKYAERVVADNGNTVAAIYDVTREETVYDRKRGGEQQTIDF